MALIRSPSRPRRWLRSMRLSDFRVILKSMFRSNRNAVVRITIMPVCTGGVVSPYGSLKKGGAPAPPFLGRRKKAVVIMI